MNIHRFLLPASIAAAIHVALFLIQREEFTPCTVRVIEVPLAPLPTKPDDFVPEPPDQPEKSTEPVKLLGGPTPPEAPEPPALAKPDAPAIDVPEKPIFEKKDLPAIPAVTGPGEPDGIRPWGEGVGEDIFDIGRLDRVPRAKVQIPPGYPYAMSRSGINGSAKVEFEVNREGQVVRALVVECSHREFGDAAVRAVLQWRFEPGRRNGKVVPFRIAQTIDFELKPN